MTRASLRASRPLGLVPTMGALHEGHLALVKRARQENETLAVTIFVNPAQFGDGEDLDSYPRDLDRDLDLLRQEGADLVFAPRSQDVYPPGFDTWVEPGHLGDKLEGLHRPGHFRGVATVVAKLFNLVRPDRAYFGQKDGQQTLVIKQLVRDLDLGLEVVVVPTVRHEDGLACSSRNVYLTPEQRKAAPAVYRALCHAKELWLGAWRTPACCGGKRGSCWKRRPPSKRSTTSAWPTGNRLKSWSWPPRERWSRWRCAWARPG